MKTVTIDKKEYQVCNKEFLNVYIQEYCNLNILSDVGELEKLIGLIIDLSDDLLISNVITINSTYGGFVPLQLSRRIKNNYISFTDEKKYEEHISNFSVNKSNYGDNQINHINNEDIRILLNQDNNDLFILFFQEIIDSDSKIIHDNIYNLFQNHIVILKENDITLPIFREKCHKLTNTDYFVYIPTHSINEFNYHFKYYFDQTDSNEFNYSNSINLCIMVKNGGDQFENMLLKNLHIIDRWTILDTGSTDRTIEIINKVLVGKKKGKLYQEPFIDFKNSRNRLLDLAGETCKYTLMLDDTYIIEGDLRKFLKFVEGDQFSDSFTLYIKSDDTEYGSNRLLKSNRKLRYLYKIHEVVQSKNNNNVVIPITDANIFDGRFDYMEERTMKRKELDLKLLQEELDDDPTNPRTYYYFGQTYNLLNDYEKAFEWFNKRVEHDVEGFIQEKVDAAFEAARTANYKLNKPWEECEKLYFRAYDLDKSRPESLYFIGIHYFLDGYKQKAYDYFKRAFHIGYPLHCQYSLKPTLSFHFLPKFLTQLCYEFGDFELGQKSAELFLKNNKPGSEYYDVISSWYMIFVKLNDMNINIDIKVNFLENKKLLCFVADGGFSSWTGSDILTKGVGGSETYIIEMARYIQKQGQYNVIVFCNCEGVSEFEGVFYVPIKYFPMFAKQKYIDECIVSRYSEYIPVCICGNVKNFYLVLHDLTPTGCIIIDDIKLKKIFCLSEWHVGYFLNIFPQFKDKTTHFYYGIDKNKFAISRENDIKIKNSFIYSSFPNRGLLELLKMWPTIISKFPDASLHIYCNVDNEWSNRVEPKKMNDIKELLNNFNNRKELNVHYHGWVSKSELANAWKRSDYWFYPCTFMETFCLTALEAASSKTLAITNNLAALQNTVGNRGVYIEGNPETDEWKIKALELLFKIMNDNITKEYFLNLNYEWASNLTWENQANKLISEHINV